jgi:hypothetical protein
MGTRALRLGGGGTAQEGGIDYARSAGLETARARLENPSGGSDALASGATGLALFREPTPDPDDPRRDILARLWRLNRHTELDPMHQVRTAREAFRETQRRLRGQLQDRIDRQDMDRPSAHRRKFAALGVALTSSDVVTTFGARMEYMRLEARRQQLVEAVDTYRKSGWFHRFLRHVTRDSREVTEGERHVVNHVKRVLEAGKALSKKILFGIVLTTPPDYYKLDEVQGIIAWLREELNIDKAVYRDFLEAHALPVPSSLKRKEVTLSEASQAARLLGRAKRGLDVFKASSSPVMPSPAAAGGGGGPGSGPGSGSDNNNSPAVRASTTTVTTSLSAGSAALPDISNEGPGAADKATAQQQSGDPPADASAATKPAAAAATAAATAAAAAAAPPAPPTQHAGSMVRRGTVGVREGAMERRNSVIQLREVTKVKKKNLLLG